MSTGNAQRCEASLEYRVGHLGTPGSWEPWSWTTRVDWTADNLARLKALGFNTVQLNVAWGARPGDEPLNLEDVVELTPEQEARLPQPVPLRGSAEEGRWEQRRADLRARIALCSEAGLRTLFHFGAPYNAHARYGDNPPNCISDPDVTERYALLVRAFAAEFPGVDDLHLYTYDQDAWLCSEFGDCPRCAGVPLARRLAPFLDRLTAEWRAANANGRLWWEPWELSAGQSLACIGAVNPEGFGLALHVNAGECMATIVADRWFRNMAAAAAARGIPVVGEYFLGAQSEETEPLTGLAHPLVTLRALRSLAGVRGLRGIKEYYGLVPDVEDPNLRMAGIFFAQPGIGEDEALAKLAEPYGDAAAAIQRFWRLSSEGMELFPWEVSWYIREIGRSAVDHSLAAAMIHGQQCSTPSWDSTRHSVFMKVDDRQPHPWMLEDVQVRCEMAASRWREAEALGSEIARLAPEGLRDAVADCLRDQASLRRRAVAYACHLRETNLATVIRRHSGRGADAATQGAIAELLSILQADRENWREEVAANTGLPGTYATWPEIDEAIALLQQDPAAFLERFLIETPYHASKGIFSLTSR